MKYIKDNKRWLIPLVLILLSVMNIYTSHKEKVIIEKERVIFIQKLQEENTKLTQLNTQLKIDYSKLELKSKNKNVDIEIIRNADGSTIKRRSTRESEDSSNMSNTKVSLDNSTQITEKSEKVIDTVSDSSKESKETLITNKPSGYSLGLFTLVDTKSFLKNAQPTLGVNGSFPILGPLNGQVLFTNKLEIGAGLIWNFK